MCNKKLPVSFPPLKTQKKQNNPEKGQHKKGHMPISATMLMRRSLCISLHQRPLCHKLPSLLDCTALLNRSLCTQGELAATAVNAPMVPAEVLVELQPFVSLSQGLGTAAVQLVRDTGFTDVKITYASPR